MPILREFWEWGCPYHCDTGTIPTELTGTRLPNGVPGFVFRPVLIGVLPLF